MINFSIIIPHHTKTDTILLERAVDSVPDKDQVQILVIDNSPLPIDANLFDKRKNVGIIFSGTREEAVHANNIGID